MPKMPQERLLKTVNMTLDVLPKVSWKPLAEDVKVVIIMGAIGTLAEDGDDDVATIANGVLGTFAVDVKAVTIGATGTLAENVEDAATLIVGVTTS